MPTIMLLLVTLDCNIHACPFLRHPKITCMPTYRMTNEQCIANHYVCVSVDELDELLETPETALEASVNIAFMNHNQVT